MKKKTFLGLVLVLVFGILIISTFKSEAAKPEQPETFIKFLNFGSIVVDTNTPYESPPIDCSNYSSVSVFVQVENQADVELTITFPIKFGPVGDVDEVVIKAYGTSIPARETFVRVEVPMPVLAEFFKFGATIISEGTSAKLDFKVVLTK